ncbi:hypothetical protein ACWGDS_11075 [Streptomyces sp. NPDC055059]|jgi:hypothetical protein|uniref:hypothetical protein n=1 Tax=Streptomyces sp. NPDC127172 TaxID=3345382 RepID=UPI0036272B34
MRLRQVGGSPAQDLVLLLQQLDPPTPVDTDKGKLRQSWLSHKDLLRSSTIRIKLSDKPTSRGMNAAPPAMAQD